MFSRRGILGLFSGLISWFAAKKVATAKGVIIVEEYLPEGHIPLPEWCPEGFIPMLGQNISKEQFPALFEPIHFERKNGSKGRYLPPFHGLEIAPLPNRQPTIPTGLQALGFADNLTYNLRKDPDTRIVVHLMAAKSQITSNGRVNQAGFCMAMAIEREKFEAFYGPIEESGKSKLFYSCYDCPDPYGA